MAEKSSFFNSVAGDRRYTATDFADYFSPLITNGFFPSDLNLKVYAEGSTMGIIVKSGRAWINGYQYVNTSDLNFTLDIADGVLNRIDRIVVQLDFVNRQIRTVVKKGAAASSPVPPQIQRDADIYELGIATVLITAGATSIVDSNITDTRNDVTVGGIVNNLFADANAQAKNVVLDDISNYYLSTNVEGALKEIAQPLDVIKSNFDDSSIAKTVTWKLSGVTVKTSILSNPNVDGNYLTRTVTLYESDGITARKTIVLTRTFDSSGNLVSEVIT